MTGKADTNQGIRIKCPGCGRVYRLPTESVPIGKDMTVSCPNCKTKMEVKGEGLGPLPSVSNIKEQGDENIEYFDPGTKVALVACQDPLALLQIEKGLKELGFQIRNIATASELSERFKYYAYPIVILNQSGADIEPELKRMLASVNQLPMDSRRKTVVIFIHLRGNRFDTLQAFSYGCDLTMSPLDLTNFSTIIERAIQEKFGRYKVLEDVKREMEKGILYEC